MKSRVLPDVKCNTGRPKKQYRIQDSGLRVLALGIHFGFAMAEGFGIYVKGLFTVWDFKLGF